MKHLLARYQIHFHNDEKHSSNAFKYPDELRYRDSFNLHISIHYVFEI